MSVIVVGIDGSDGSRRATLWCAEHAPRLAASVVAVHAVDTARFGSFIALDPAIPVAVPNEAELRRVRDVAEREWCKPLVDAGVDHRVVVAEGNAVAVLRDVAEAERADLVVTGRRGRGGFAELVLGSTSHQLVHHLACPLLIVP
jgi:nucleotide-binding universal stress UspA family protein